MRKISHFIHHHSESAFHTFALSETSEFINADPQNATTKPGFCYFVVI